VASSCPRFSPLTPGQHDQRLKAGEGAVVPVQPGRQASKSDSPSELYQEITPIVVNDVMYMPAGDRVVALEPDIFTTSRKMMPLNAKTGQGRSGVRDAER
jgi:hypothetical protein